MTRPASTATQSKPGPSERELLSVAASIRPTDPSGEHAARTRLDQLTKPPGSLGRLEDIAAQVARVQGLEKPSVARKVVLLMAGDHGVVAEGITPYPQDVTWQMVANIVSGGAAICQIAASVGADLRVYDVGVARDITLPGVVARKVAYGTRNMAVEPAMTREECAEAVLTGIHAARDAAADGYTLIATGEMGIGNSTAAAALTAAYTGADAGAVAGPGTGLSKEGVARKARILRDTLALHATADLDALGKLAAVGGLEIAALAGVLLGSAEQGICVVSDGFISGSATLAAVALCPVVAEYVFASHLSAEPGHPIMLAHLGMQPLLDLDMRLGEGTGAALAMAVIDAACRCLSNMATFSEAGVSSGNA
ncbi:MAG: nicotinate-nucleotide--dimethylbenzimidazole phosphoribosyltransferase [Clostridiales bacterium]|nr:nicotinate-nucleotide--dimethylbenzimidazole phosphoribosyltransferase [Clostridiales bacterium]